MRKLAISILVSNCIPVIVFSYLAIHFQKWWIAPIAILFFRGCKVYLPVEDDENEYLEDEGNQ